VVELQEIPSHNKLMSVIDNLKKKVSEQIETIGFLGDQLLQSEDRLKDVHQQGKATKKDGKMYSADIREASYHLMDLAMAEENV